MSATTTFEDVAIAIQALRADQLEGFALFLDRQIAALVDDFSSSSSSSSERGIAPAFEALAAISRGEPVPTRPLEPFDDSSLRLLGQAALKLPRSAEYVDIAADLADDAPGLGEMSLRVVERPAASAAVQDVWRAVLVAVRREQNRRWRAARQVR